MSFRLSITSIWEHSCFGTHSVQFSRSVVSDSLWHHEPQHARPPCASPTPGVYPNPRPLSQWCHPAISSSVTPFSSCPQSFPASGSFPMSWHFTSHGQSIVCSFSISPSNEYSGLILGLTGLISLLRVFSTPQESSPAPQFESISSSTFRRMYVHV